MNTRYKISILAVVALVAIGLTIGSLTYTTNPNPETILLVGFDQNFDFGKFQSIIDRYGGEILEQYTIISAIAVKVPASVATILESLPGVSYVEQNQKYYADVIPNDPQWSSLWGMQRIQADSAWDITTGSNEVLVAVIDEGIDVNHPDLAANIWVNPGEIAGNGIDDDGNGYVDDINGWNFVDDNGQVYGGNPNQDTHGTHVAGTIGAVGNNGVGVVGVNWNVKMMSLKFLGSQGGSTADGISAIQYATMMGADIISASWGGGGYSQAMKDAIDAFPGLFVAAAGNDGVDNDASPHYPSSYSSANLIAVASSTSTDSMSSFSNYGATSVDIAAPGSSILSTYPGNNYNTISGTSMATPHVSGAAALLLANDPTLTATQLKQKLMDYSDPVPAFSGKVVSGGILNVYRALTGAAPPPPPPTQTDTFTGTVSSSVKNQIHYFDVTATTSQISATLTWPGSTDVDMYLYAPGSDPNGGSWVTRAYTTSNPETMSYSPTQTGTWAIRVNHYSGSSATYTLEVTYPVSEAPPPDTTAPSVTISSPTGTVSGSVTVQATITDNIGVVSADYRVDGGIWVSMTNTVDDEWTATLDTTALADGTHTLEVRGADAAGNTGSATGTFTSSNTAPPPPDGQETFTGTVSSSVKNQIFYFDVTATGDIVATLSWPGSADVDMYLYAPGSDPNGGGWVARAYTLNNPESITYSATQTGTWAIRVNHYSGSSASFTLDVTYPVGGGTGTGEQTFTGTVSSSVRNQVFYFDITATGDIVATLSWPGSADIDMYLYAPGSDPYGSSWVKRAYTLSNPESITYTATQTGTWAIRVNHYSGSSASFTLEVSYPITLAAAGVNQPNSTTDHFEPQNQTHLTIFEIL